MNFLRAIIGIVVTIFLALLLGRTQRSKHAGIHFYSWAISIVLLLLMRWFL